MKDVIVPYILEVIVYDDQSKPFKIKAKVDSGADNCSIDEKVAKKMGLSDKDDIIAEAEILNANGSDTRPVIEIEFEVEDQRIKTLATVADRSNLDTDFLIGRSALKNNKIRFLIDPISKAANDLRKLAKKLTN